MSHKLFDNNKLTTQTVQAVCKIRLNPHKIRELDNFECLYMYLYKSFFRQ